MTEPNKYQDWILETIDSLRSRKARPDLERICRMVRRRHGSDPDQTRTELEKLIQSQTVLKVSYKGSISYRNAAKVLRKSRKKSELVTSSGQSCKQEHLNNSSDSAHSFIDPEEASVGPSESKPRPDYPLSSGCDRAAPPDQQTASASSTGSGLLEGCSLPSRVGHTASAHSGTTPLTDEPHGVNSMNNKSLTVPPLTQTPSLMPKVRATNSAHGDRVVASVRSLSAASTGHTNPLGLKDILGYLSSQERLCGEKLTRGNVKVVMEREVAWGRLRRTRCGNITLLRPGAASEEPSDRGEAISSQDNDPMQTESVDEKGWQENIEEHTKEEIPLSYEEDVGIPPVAMTTEEEPIEKSLEDAEIQTASKQHWTKGKSWPDSLQALETCPTAVQAQSVGDMEIDESSCLLTPTASPVDSGVSDEPLGGGLLSPIDWTVSDVVSYFTAAGFPDQASAFKTQEIDGKALLLMHRNDVLTGLSIKLGPALKIYEHHIKALQKTHFEDDNL